VPWDERPLIGSKRGLPWWGAVLLGFGLAILGAFVDMKLQGHLTLLFSACYCGGAVLAVCAVQRRGLFGPMVQPPIVQAVTVPGVILLAAGMPAGGDTLATLLKVGQPLIDGFPVMAVTTGVTVLIGFFRMYRERDPDRAVKLKSKKPLNSNPATTASKRPADERPSAGDTGARVAAGRGRPRPPAADGQPPRRRNPAADPGMPGAAGRRTRPAPEDDARRPRGSREGDERDPGARSARQPQEPGARGPGPRQPRAPRDEPGAPRRRGEPRADGAPGEPRARRAPRADDPRRGTDDPRRAPAPGRRGDTPPPRGRT
jgi:hypothetical protein